MITEYIFLALFGLAIIVLAAGMLIISIKKHFPDEKPTVEK